LEGGWNLDECDEVSSAPPAVKDASSAAATHHLMQDIDVYRTIGESGFHRLVAAFYRQVPTDNILGPMYPAEDLPGAEERLRDFLIGRFGGPPRYIERRGHPRLRVRHMPFAVNGAARERWLQCMGHALDEASFPPEVDLFLRGFFHEVATMLVNRPG
jgi:hemoglobin